MTELLKNKKGFETPELKIIIFTNEEIITASGDFTDSNDDPSGNGDDL